MSGVNSRLPRLRVDSFVSQQACSRVVEDMRERSPRCLTYWEKRLEQVGWRVGPGCALKIGS